MNAFQNLRNKEPVPKPLLAEWGGVVDYAHQPWARRLPGVLLAALFLTGLLLWMGLPSWFLH